LVFLHDSSGEMQRTDGAQSIDNTLFFQRLGQRLVHLLTVHSAVGPTLRSRYASAARRQSRACWCSPLAAFRDYEFQDAWTWEHQSLLRARAIAGPRELCEQFEAARIEVLRKAVKRDGLRDEVRRMRERMRENLSKARQGRSISSRIPGGIADLEFLVQFWMLKVGGPLSEIVTFSDNIRQLESSASGAIVPQQRVDFLVATYRAYRQRLHRASRWTAPTTSSMTRSSWPSAAASWKSGRRSCARPAICDNAAPMSTEPGAKLIQPNAKNQYMVAATDLPLSCPDAGHVPVELASARVPADREDRLGEVPVLRRRVHADPLRCTFLGISRRRELRSCTT
jgi:glutamine synthetase adenylyltransferase